MASNPLYSDAILDLDDMFEEDDEFGNFDLALADEDDDFDDFDDEDDAFGADYVWYGADEEHDELDDLESEIDQELYGRSTSVAYKEGPLAYAAPFLDDAVQPGNVIAGHKRKGKITEFFNWIVEVFNDDDAAEIAAHIEEDPRWEAWLSGSLDDATKIDVVEQSILKSRTLGRKMTADDVLRGKTSWTEMIKAMPEAFWQMTTVDTPAAITAWIDEFVPGNWFTSDPDQIINGYAALLYIMDSMSIPVYAWMMQSIDAHVAEAMESGRGQVLPFPGEYEAPEMETMPTPIADVAPGVSGLPRPQSILAVGYGLSILLPLLGIGNK